ncbi:DUF6602 domain-containing protein [Pseudomonas capsici]|uniref:DUF6602 domain-containing protein n=1 Tax=Pseudomonas capsici TaxID=2810614 RepID=UPI00384EBF75
MSRYFDHLADQLASKISQAKVYITKHNPSTGALAEAVLREFLQEHLPGQVRAEQGFILSPDGGLSKQCDILIYDAHRYAPFYRAGAVVVVPVEAVIAVIEVKTSINQARLRGGDQILRGIRLCERHLSYLSIYVQRATYGDPVQLVPFLSASGRQDRVRSRYFPSSTG